MNNNFGLSNLHANNFIGNVMEFIDMDQDESVMDIESFNLKYQNRNIFNSGKSSQPLYYYINNVQNESRLSKNCLAADSVIERKTIINKINKSPYSNNDNNNTLIVKNITSISTIKQSNPGQFSLKLYLRRIIDKMLTKQEIRKIIIKFIDKENIDLENVILFRKLKSNSKKEELTSCLIGVIFNIMKKSN